MEQQAREAIRKGLRRIEGQVQGLQRMVDQQRECDEVLVQIAAVKAALDRITRDLVRCHAEACLAPVADEALRQRLQRTLDQLSRM
ncbi:MAG: metal-sensitive transcriptional regulator [Candidatus Sericytochromatia bacterium]|nr:metal-sensitive transcriptional regulator [Candidatus Sericytochromatia bacterium]